MRRLIRRLFPLYAVRLLEKELLSRQSDLDILQANLDGTQRQLQQIQGQLAALEDSHSKEVDSLRHMVDWFAVQSPQRQQVFGTLPESSLPKREPSSVPVQGSVRARNLAREMTLEFMQEAVRRSEENADLMKRNADVFSSETQPQ